MSVQATVAGGGSGGNKTASWRGSAGKIFTEKTHNEEKLLIIMSPECLIIKSTWTGHHPLMLSCYVWLFTTPWTPRGLCPARPTHQAPLSLGFSRQEYWSGFPFPPPGDLPNPGIEPTSPAYPALAGGFFSTKPPGKPWWPSLYDKHKHLFLSGDPVGLCPNS